MSHGIERPRRYRKTDEIDETGVVTVSKALAPQLGSDHEYISKGKIDRRVLSVLNDYTQAAIGYFAYRGEVDKIRFFEKMVEWELASTPSIGGLARRQIIQETHASTGAGRGALDVAERPGWIGRHFTERGWKEKATKEGKVIVE